MFGFFERGMTWNKGMQLFNTAAFSMALYHLVTDPEAKAAELGLDLITHAYSLWCLQDNPGFKHQLAGQAINLVRLGELYGGVMSGITQIPLLVSTIDAIGHLLNTGSILMNHEKKEVSTSPKPM